MLMAKTHILAYHMMTCGCALDDDPDFMQVCDMHLNAKKLLEACQLAYLKPQEPETREFIHAVLSRIPGAI